MPDRSLDSDSDSRLPTFPFEVPPEFPGTPWEGIGAALDSFAESGFVGVDKQIEALRKAGYEHAEIQLVMIQRMVTLAAPSEVSDAFRGAILRLVDVMRQSFDASANER